MHDGMQALVQMCRAPWIAESSAPTVGYVFEVANRLLCAFIHSGANKDCPADTAWLPNACSKKHSLCPRSSMRIWFRTP